MGKNLLNVLVVVIVISFTGCSGKKHLIADASAETQAATQEAENLQNSSPKPPEESPEISFPVTPAPENAKQPTSPAPEEKASSTPSDIEGKTTLPAPPVPEEKNQPPTIEEKQLTESTPAEKEGAVQKEIQMPRAQTPASFEEGEEIVFNFDNADLNEVVSAIGDILGINYIAPPGLTGVVNIHTKGKLAKKELFSVLETVLKLNNFTIVKKGDLYTITPLQ
ncbi:MAG TPA: hypothetical protein PKV48_06810, partial [Thermodesulfobacteriota bacterium]|nr:hypothetical protein [Thermodesulfobacteriota bacterium]